MEDTQKPLPQLHQADLDSETLATYFCDLAACATIIGITPKLGEGYVAPGSIDLTAAQQLVASGAARGLQIRYHYQGAEWWDTLMVRDGTVRLVRIEQDFS